MAGGSCGWPWPQRLAGRSQWPEAGGRLDRTEAQVVADREEAGGFVWVMGCWRLLGRVGGVGRGTLKRTANLVSEQKEKQGLLLTALNYSEDFCQQLRRGWGSRKLPMAVASGTPRSWVAGPETMVPRGREEWTDNYSGNGWLGQQKLQATKDADHGFPLFTFPGLYQWWGRAGLPLVSFCPCTNFHKNSRWNFPRFVLCFNKNISISLQKRTSIVHTLKRR